MMDDRIGRSIYKKRALFGYDPQSVQDRVQMLQQEHIEKSKRLKSRLIEVQAENKRLKEHLKEGKDSPVVNPEYEEVSSTLMTAFLEHTKEIERYKKELSEKEFDMLHLLEEKQKDKDQAQDKVQEVIDYLHSLQTLNSSYRKELDDR